jgi:RNA polymerase sigma-70 factor (ECF subfamily)
MNLAAAAPLAAPVRAPAIALAELIAHRAYLVRFAQRRLHDPMLAEDVVHDVFEAVLDGRAAFGGRAALRSWLTAVLKHKIVDLVRRRPLHASLDDEGAASDALAEACPQPRPDEAAEQRERLRRALARIEALPASLREVMRLRVLEERDTAEVCTRLAISEENLFVRLHRARRQLLA